MLATFVIGLREGLEAALIVGIIAAFLTQDGKSRALRSMWIGVGVAVALSLGVGIALTLLSGSLPQRQQEMLETVIGFIAVAMVTWMVLWMRKHSRNLKKELGAAVHGALATGSTFALVAMAFLAVIREGVETAVFLVAASQTRSGTTTFVGAGLGIVVAIVLGYLIYRGGVRINLSKFFRFTGAVLVLVAGGVLMSSLAHAHEADWLNLGTQTWIDLSGIIGPGSVQESLLGGVLGIQAQLSAVAVLGWLLYVVPMLAVVLWPARRLLSARTTSRLLLTVGAAGALVAVALALLIPAASVPTSTTHAAAGSGSTASITVSTPSVSGAAMTAVVGGSVTVDGTGSGTQVDVPAESRALRLATARTIGGRSVSDYTSDRIVVRVPDAVATMTAAQLAELNGGRYPVGLRAADATTSLQTSETVTVLLTVTVDSATGLPIAVAVSADAAVIATASSGRTHRVELGSVDLASTELPAASGAVVPGLSAATAVESAQVRAQTFGRLVPWMLGVWSALLLAAAGLVLIADRRRAAVPPRPGAARTSPNPPEQPSLATSSAARSGDPHR